MATIGHSLVGLSCGTVWRPQPATSRLRYAWPGLMVLMGHLVDIVEWCAILIAPGCFAAHFVTNSPAVTVAIVATVWLVLAVSCRRRPPWLYLSVAAAVFSHLLLDHPIVRRTLVDVYCGPTTEILPDLERSIAAEVWLYGWVFVCALLVQAGRSPACPRRGRILSVLLGVAAALAASTKMPAFWIPAYLLAVLHAGLILRRDLSIRFAWSVVPIIPILLLLGVELRARTLFREAEFLFDQREYARAAELFERAVAVPTRSSKAVVLVHLGHCRMHIGDLTGAEDAMLRACADRESGVWASYMLGAFYINNRTRGTSYFQPSKAVGLFAKVIQESDDATLRRYAQDRLDDINHRAADG